MVGDVGGLGVGSGDGAVVAAVDVAQAVDKGAARAGDVCGGDVHRHLEGGEEVAVGGEVIAQEAVALLQGVVVPHKAGQVAGVGLRDGHVDKAAPVFARAVDEVHVGGRNQHAGEAADVLGDACVVLAAALDRLAPPFGEAYGNLLGGTLAGVAALEHGKVVAATHQQPVGGTREAAAEAQVVDGVHHVALAHAVVAEEAVELGREGQVCRADVLEVGEGDFVKSHFAMALSAPAKQRSK